MAGSVPRANSLSDIYATDAVAAQSKRWQSLVSKFKDLYSETPAFVARSPGRVNIIGEHIDYSLYSVLPMAITADVLIAASFAPPTSGATFRIQIANIQDDKFHAREFDVDIRGDVEIDASIHEWTNYFKSGLRGALQLLRKKRGDALKPMSMRILMDGSVPAGGGLSSSAAFVTSSALAVMVANGEETVDKKELTELAIVSERAVGVNSGGMDQSASVFSLRDSALFVSFSPSLSARPVRFPKTDPEICFVTAQSFVAADKHVTGPIHYNLRVVECTLAAAYLNAVLNPPGTQLPTDTSPLGISIYGFHETYFYHQASGSSEYSAGGVKSLTIEEQLEALLKLTDETLTQEEGYTREEIAGALAVSVDELESNFMSRFPVRAERFKLRQRAQHVFAEALRVLVFLSLLESAEASAADFNDRLGALLNETQDSCRDVYECSCPEIDEICAIARRAGAYGSRLTGAGWGGCTVHLVPVENVARVKDAWESEYYSKRDLSSEQREKAVVVSKPGSGSAIFVVRPGVVM